MGQNSVLLGKRKVTYRQYHDKNNEGRAAQDGRIEEVAFQTALRYETKAVP